MEVFGNGHKVIINIQYGNPFVTVIENNKKYTIQIAYENAGDVMLTVQRAIRENGNDLNFWSILGEKLKEQFRVVDFEQKETKQQTKQKKTVIKDNIPQIEMTANYAKILFKGSFVDVVFTNENNEDYTVTFKYRKSWSNRRYIDTVFDKTGIKPSWDFRYGWERVGA
jgi:hypothetical protein